MLDLDEIEYDRLKPGVDLEVRPNYTRQGLLPFPARTLIFVQKLATGSAVPKRLYEITRKEEGTTLFGVGSIGDSMVTAYKLNNKPGRVFAIALEDDAAAVAATGKLVFTGAGFSGTLPLYVGTTRVRVLATTGMTLTQLATAVAAALNAVATLPVTAATNATAGEVVLTAKHKGETGNAIRLRVARRQDEAVPAGLTVAITPMAGGSANPDVQDLIDAIANQWFTDLVMPWDDSANLQALAAELEARYKAMGRKDAHAYFGASATYAGAITKGAITNSPQLTFMPAKNSATPPWIWAAALGAVCAFQLTNDPSRQLRGLELAGVEAPDDGDRFTEDEQNLLLKSGCSTFNVLDDGTVTLDRVVTTYKQSNLGVADRAWLDIMVPKTMTRIRYDWRAHVSLVYPRSKLADDESAAANADTVEADPENPGKTRPKSVVTPRRMHGTWASRCKVYERQAWIENVQRTVAESTFTRSEDDRNMLIADQQVRVIGNLMRLVGALEFQV